MKQLIISKRRGLVIGALLAFLLCAGILVPKLDDFIFRKSLEKSLSERVSSLGFTWPETLSRDAFFQAILEAEQRYGIERELLLSVAIIESGLEPSSVSEKGALGVFQLKLATAESLWSDFSKTLSKNDPLLRLSASQVVKDVRGATLLGAYYLSALRSDFSNHMHLALAAYNVGPGALRRAMAIGELKGTEYIFRVYQLRNELRGPRS